MKIETDHKTLETILSKSLHVAPARLQRMMMSIQRYPITVQYRTGKELLITDTLSSAPMNEEATELEFHEHDINIHIPYQSLSQKLQELPSSHLGIEKCQCRARDV